jgi:hypothetical protein
VDDSEFNDLGGFMAATDPNKGKKSGPKPGRLFRWGILSGVGNDTMTVHVLDSKGKSLGTDKEAGLGYSLKFMLDTLLFWGFDLRTTIGLESFNVSGDKICGETSTEVCDAKIMYLSTDFMARWLLTGGSFRIWPGFGFSLMQPMAKKASAVTAGSIKMTGVISAAFGVDWYVTHTLFIPLSVEYGILPKSTQAEASWIMGRFGLGFGY